MLYHHLLSSPDDKIALYQKYFLGTHHFIVSDLFTKLWLQKSLLQDSANGVVCTNRIYRASEYWEKCLHDLDWGWRTLPSDLAMAQLQELIRIVQREYDIKISPRDSSRLFHLMGQLLPLLIHGQGSELLHSWFEEQPEAKDRWGDWHLMASLSWKKMYELKIVPQDWMKGVLLSEQAQLNSGVPLVFDLDQEIDETEAELILNLSQYQDVVVLIPERSQERPAYNALLATSSDLPVEMAPQSAGGKKIMKLPTQLSEVKQVTSQIRQWLDLGIKPDQIAVVSSLVEEYWPLLSSYLSVEGVPVQKAKSTPLSQLPLLQKWVSLMRSRLDRVSSSDLEQIFFLDQEKPKLSQAVFKKHYSFIYESSDLERFGFLGQLVDSSQQNPQSLVTLSEFLDWSFKPFVETEQLLMIEYLAGIEEYLTYPLHLSFRQWMDFFIDYLSRHEWQVAPADVEGVMLLHPSQALLHPCRAIILLGLSEQALSEGSETPLTLRDVESLKFLFGFNLKHRDQQIMAERLHWWLSKGADQFLILYSESDFSGGFQSPSLFWLELAKELEHNLEMNSPDPTRWDELMGSAAVKNDEALEPVLTPQFSWAAEVDLSLSASKFEEFLKCPFRLFAQAGLRLSHDSVFDLDLDPMNRGRLLHKICEKVIRDKLWDLDDQGVRALVEDCARDLDIEFYSETFAEFLKADYQKKTKDFIRAELQWRNEFPATETIGFEVPLSSHLYVEEGQARFSANKGRKFRGLIDRIDGNGKNEAVLIDYKSSATSLSQYKSWLEKGLVQLILYGMALEDGALPLEQKPIGLYYYVLKDMSRSYGIHQPSSAQEFLPTKKVSEGDFAELLDQGRAIIAQALQRIENGDKTPSPSDPKHCEHCNWRNLCRYPMLHQ